MAQQIRITQTSNADMNIGIPKQITMAQQTAVMQLINFILAERRQEDGSIKFHAHEDFSKFLQMEKEQIVKAWELRATPYPTEGMGYSIIDATGEQYYNETYGENKD